MARGRLSLLLLLGLTASASEPRWEVLAEEMVLEDGRLVATGSVRLQRDGQTLFGSELIVEDETSALLTEGRWESESGVLEFARGELDLETGEARLHEARLETPDGERLIAETITVPPNGPLLATDVTWRPCACPGPEPWSVTARRVVLDPETVLRARSGWLRMFGVPLVPIPVAEVPLTRRSGFLAPTVQWGEQGLTAATPLYLTAGEQADVTLTPEVRTRRSVRLLGEVRYATRSGEGALEGGAGWDLVEERIRGALTGRGSGSRGTLGHAYTTQLVSDLGVFRDYGDRFLDRSLPWTESRALIGIPALELSTDTFQSQESTVQDLLRLDASAPSTDWGFGVVGHAQLWGIARRRAPSAWAPGTWEGYGQLSAQIQRPTRLGPLIASPRLATRGEISAGINPLVLAQESFAGVDLSLPMWRDVPGHFERLVFTVSGGAHLSDTVRPRAQAAMIWRRTGRTLLEVRPRVGLTGEVVEAAIDGTVRSGPVHLRVEAGWTAGQLGAAVWGGWTSDAVSLLLGALYADHETIVQADPSAPEDALLTMATASLRLPGPLSTVRLLGGLRAEPLAWTWQSRSAGVRWGHPTGCIELGSTVTFSPDRALPDVALLFRLAP